jgi:hypothetical protein
MHPFNFPQPEADETLHSLLIHAYRLSGFTSFRDFTEVLFGSPSDGRGWSWRFKKVGKHLDSCKVTAWALLQGTLLLPYLMPFMSPEVARIGQNRLDGGHRTGEHGVQPAWHINNSRPLNYCPLCVRMHMRRFRRSMWLRCHQLDGVNVCWRHAVNLVGVRQSRTEPQFPHEFPGQTISYNFNKSDLWLAKQSRILLHASHGPTTADLRKMTYRTQAERVGYGKATRIDYFQIAVHLLRRFGRPFVQRILGSFEVDHVTGLVHSTINGGDIGIRPANHILCIEVLFGEQLKFFQALKGHAGKVLEDNANLSSLHKDEPSTSRVHKKIFLEELALSGRDVMVALDRKFPHTHTWIITNALHWSRRRLSAAFPKRKK